LPPRETIRGGVDHLNRPFVRLGVTGFAEPVTAFIDTGFNGSLIVDEYQAQQMGFQVTKIHSITALLASQRSETFLLCRGRINWLGDEPFITALVISETETQRLERRRRKRNEEVVLGVELLINCKLEVDFVRRSVSITRLS
jgi:predicted aspartyl protease